MSYVRDLKRFTLFANRENGNIFSERPGVIIPVIDRKRKFEDSIELLRFYMLTFNSLVFEHNGIYTYIIHDSERATLFFMDHDFIESCIRKNSTFVEKEMSKSGRVRYNYVLS